MVSPDNVKKLCPCCANEGHSAKNCDKVDSHGRSSIKKSLAHNYECFQPAGYKRQLQIQPRRRQNHFSSHFRSCSRSRSRSTSKPHTEQGNSNSTSSKGKKRVSYTDMAAKPNSLNSSSSSHTASGSKSSDSPSDPKNSNSISPIYPGGPPISQAVLTSLLSQLEQASATLDFKNLISL